MNLSTFRTRVREKLKDNASSSNFYSDSVISDTLDEVLRGIWGNIVRKVPHYFLSYNTVTGQTDAVDAAFEQYPLPADFREMLIVRRSDQQHRPIVKFKSTEDHDDFRYIGNDFYNREADEPPSFVGESWSFYDSSHFQILPHPSSTSYTYELKYYRVHTAASGGTDAVDAPDDYLKLVTLLVAFELALLTGDPVASAFQLLIEREKININRYCRISVGQCPR